MVTVNLHGNSKWCQQPASIAVGQPTFDYDQKIDPPFSSNCGTGIVEKYVRRSTSVSLPKLSFSDYVKLVARLAVAILNKLDSARDATARGLQVCKGRRSV